MTKNTHVADLIQRRYSCRTYENQAINPDTRQLLTAFIDELVPGPFGSTSHFKLVSASAEDRAELKGLGTYGFIKGATGYIIGATVNIGKNLEDFGYLMESIILFATEVGLGTCWLGGTFTRSSFAKWISANENEVIPAVTSVGYIHKKPRKLDRRVRDEANSDRRIPWSELFFDGSFEMPLLKDNAGEFAQPLEMVRKAPSASNKQPWRIIKDQDAWHFYLLRTPGYLDNRYLKIVKIEDLQRVDMGIAMCHFELTARELGLAGEWNIIKSMVEQPGQVGEYLVSWVPGSIA